MENNNGGGAPGAQGGGAADGNQGDSPNTPPNNSNPQPKAVPWEDHKRAIDDLHKFKKGYQDLEAKVGKIESDRLREKEDYKGLAEREKQRADSLEAENKRLTEVTVNTHRFNEVRAEAQRLGLRPEAARDLELVDLADVEVEATSSGRFLVRGAKERVEKLKSERPHWFTQTAPPNVNAGGGGAPPPTGGGKTTVDDVVKAEKLWKAGKITQDAYKETYNKYLKDNPAHASPGAPPPRT